MTESRGETGERERVSGLGQLSVFRSFLVVIQALRVQFPKNESRALGVLVIGYFRELIIAQRESATCVTRFRA
jgi:hypothetical protein